MHRLYLLLSVKQLLRDDSSLSLREGIQWRSFFKNLGVIAVVTLSGLAHSFGGLSVSDTIHHVDDVPTARSVGS